jgi:DNA-binding transcriptional MerR regulator
MSTCEQHQPSFFLDAEVIWIENETTESVPQDAPVLGISEVATRLGLTPRALRFYEGRGLVAPARHGRARYYRARDIDRLSLIVKAKKLGFTLTEISEMVQAGEGANTGSLRLTREKCVEQIAVMQRQLEESEAALQELRRIHTLLNGDVR